MKKTLISLLVIVAFVVGCGASIVAQQFLVPPAHAAVTEKWEYFCFNPQGMRVPSITEDAQKKLNEAAQQGWDLAHMAGENGKGFLICMKRPLP